MILTRPTIPIAESLKRVTAALLLCVSVPLLAASLSLEDLQDQVRSAMSAGEYAEAIALLTTQRSSTDPQVARFAQEYLGVVRERNGQAEFARLEYQRFLAEYPDAPEADRVKRRLDALLLDSLPATADRPAVSRAVPADKRETTYTDGRISLDYRGSSNTNDAGDTTRTLSLIGTDADIRFGHDTGDGDISARISLGHYEDLLAAGRNTTDRVRYLYADYEQNDHYRVRLGRQRSSSAAVYGRYDGIDLQYTTPWVIGVELFGGLPVESSRSDLFADDRQFVGLALNSGDAFAHWKLNFYGLHQVIGSEVDRQTIGSEIRYTGDGLFAQSLIDYDIHFGELNAAMLNINKVWERNSSLNFSYNYRKSPFLSTRNALIGQNVDSISELKNLLTSADDLETLAFDRSLDSQAVTLGFGRQLTERVMFSGSLSWLSLSEGTASGGLTSSPAYDQFYGDARLTIRDVFVDNHLLTLGIRFASQDRSDVVSLIGSSSYRRGNWKFSPRMRIDQRDNSDGSKQLNLAPALRVEYEQGAHTLFVQAGYLMYFTTHPQFPDQDYQILFTYLGYQYRF